MMTLSRGRITYLYDAASQLTTVSNPYSERTTYTYDDAGRKTVQRFSNGTRASFIYDFASNITQLHNRTSAGVAITTFDYKYDSVNNPVSIVEASGDRVTWVYDNDNRIKAERRSGTSAYCNTFTYDSTGNRTVKNANSVLTTFAYDAANQLRYSQVTAGRTTYGYDSAGNQQIEQPPTGARTTTTWDYENQPVVYRLPDATRVSMSYNSDSRRVTKQSASETVKFVWDPVADAYLSELNVSNATQVVYTQAPKQFGGVISQRRATTSNWYHTDSLGSTRALTNASQVVSDTYLYDAWGNPLTSTGTTVNPFRWVGNVGYYFDTATGLFYIRARTYQPKTARWTSIDPLFAMLALSGGLSRDPLGYRGSERDLYEYVSGNPSSSVDPFGLCNCCCCIEDVITAWHPVKFDAVGRPGVGHEFNILVVMRFIPTKGKDSPCTLNWVERTNFWPNPYNQLYRDGDEGTVYPWPFPTPPIEWELVKDWEKNRISTKCPASRSATITDIPSTFVPFKKNWSRFTISTLSFKSADGCNCPISGKTVGFKQILDFDANGNAKDAGDFNPF